jgi:hypothetical protein
MLCVISPERDGAADGVLGSVAGFADAGDLLRVFVGDSILQRAAYRAAMTSAGLVRSVVTRVRSYPVVVLLSRSRTTRTVRER